MKVPAHTLPSIENYVERGVRVGGFLRAVFSNNLFQAFARADDINRAALHNIVIHIWNYCPSECWGSPEKYEEWVKVGGLEGIRKRAEEKEND